MQNRKILTIVSILVCVIWLSSCYNHADWKLSLLDSTLTETQIDSITFIGKHHYGVNYNFLVKSDSIRLIDQEPEEYLEDLLVDSFSVQKNARIVVADFRTLSSDSIDSLWVQVVSEDFRSGWIHESDLHNATTPDDPISQFIDMFSNMHLLVFLIVIGVIGSIYLILRMHRRKALLVHVNDIRSFYPTLLAVMVAVSAAFYATIQKFAPDMWQEYYYHPTINPLICPPLLACFLATVWILFVLAIAVLDDVRSLLPPSDAFTYLCGLAAVCALNYIIFSFFTVYYIGYLFLVIYIIFAVKRYIRTIKKGK